MTIRTAMFNGQELRLSEIARITGHRHSTITDRWLKGDRGPDLWRPLDKTGPHRVDPSDTERRALVQARLQEREQARARARAEHAAAFTAPLISTDLLTPAERKGIYARIRHARQPAESFADVLALT